MTYLIAYPKTVIDALVNVNLYRRVVSYGYSVFEDAY